LQPIQTPVEFMLWWIFLTKIQTSRRNVRLFFKFVLPPWWGKLKMMSENVFLTNCHWYTGTCMSYTEGNFLVVYIFSKTFL
jgi:hypothetical protein